MVVNCKNLQLNMKTINVVVLGKDGLEVSHTFDPGLMTVQDLVNVILSGGYSLNLLHAFEWYSTHERFVSNQFRQLLHLEMRN